MKTMLARAVCLSALTLGLTPVAHTAITDNIGDFIPSYDPAFPKNADLDVVSADVVYDKPAGTFTLTGTMNGVINQLSSNAYVFGFDRGIGQPLLANIASNVLFDSVVILNADKSGSFTDILGGGAGAQLPSGSVQISGNTISATFAASLIPMLPAGKTPEQYTWNLWPRFAAILTDNYVSDFAPDNSNVLVQTVPEPSVWALLALGLGTCLAVIRRRTQ